MTIDEPKPWRVTPLVESTTLSKAAANPDAVAFYAASAGNAGLGCIHAAKALGRPAHVVAPATTTPVMLAKLRAAGATSVILHGRSLREADVHMHTVVMPAALAAGEEPVYVPPFDHETIWHGHSSIIAEVHEQLRAMGETSAPDVIACSVGGGGLLAGLLQGMDARGQTWDKTTALAVETEGAESLAKSLDTDTLVTLPGITSIATSLGCVRVAPGVFDMVRKGHSEGKVQYAVLSDAEAAMGCWRFADDERMLVEPACGVTMSLCYGGRLKRALGRPVHPDEKVVLVVCGGSNVSVTMLEKWRQQYGDLDNEVNITGPVKSYVIQDVPSAITATLSPVPTPA